MSASANPPEEDHVLFLRAVAGTVPLGPDRYVHLAPPAPRPRPRPRYADEQDSGPVGLHDRLEGGEEPTYLRDSMPRTVLRDLRRGRWVVENEIDLHGLNRDQARAALWEFLAQCQNADERCIRIIHGKGTSSPGQVALLKILVRNWLMQRDDVLAYCPARPHDGGDGALVALLRARRR